MTVEWPRHAGGLHITHNTHHAYYWTFEQMEERDEPIWVSPEEREKARCEDSVWTIQWYPYTPIGFHTISASSFEAALAAALDIDKRDS